MLIKEWKGCDERDGKENDEWVMNGMERKVMNEMERKWWMKWKGGDKWNGKGGDKWNGNELNGMEVVSKVERKAMNKIGGDAKR